MSRDLESEMSKFEAELSKLTSTTFSSHSSSSTASTTTNTNVANKPKINIQMPTSFSTQFTSQQPVQPQVPSGYAAGRPLGTEPFGGNRPVVPPAFNPSQLNRPTTTMGQTVMPSAGGVKRDVNGRILGNQPGTSGGGVSGGAAGSFDESKAKKVAVNKEKPAAGNNSTNNNNKQKTKKVLRSAGGQVWEDPSLVEWDPDDFRLFCGDLGNEVSDEALARAFQKYPSLVKARVIRDKRTGKSKGYGFVSFKNSEDFIKAMREMNGKYVGNRPIKLRKSTWKDRNLEIVKKKESEKQKMGFR